MPELSLYAEESWTSPWVFHAMVALDEKGLRYALETVPIKIPEERKPALRAQAVMAKVPMLVHGDLAFTESSAISEYLEDAFSPPAHARLLPADPRERARARQVMSFLRTSSFALREQRPTSQFFGASQRAATAALAGGAAAEAAELVRVAEQVVAHETSMFAAWCIADADLALALMRLIAAGDPVPARLAAYVRAQWARPSLRGFLDRAQAR
jgi:glutathione S-transferase